MGAIAAAPWAIKGILGTDSEKSSSADIV